MSAADLRALYQPVNTIFINGDVNRIYSTIISEAQAGKLYTDFDILIERSYKVVAKLNTIFPDVSIIELETLTYRRIYRAIWAPKIESERPAPLPALR